MPMKSRFLGCCCKFKVRFADLGFRRLRLRPTLKIVLPIYLPIHLYDALTLSNLPITQRHGVVPVCVDSGGGARGIKSGLIGGDRGGGGWCWRGGGRNVHMLDVIIRRVVPSLPWIDQYCCHSYQIWAGSKRWTFSETVDNRARVVTLPSVLSLCVSHRSYSWQIVNLSHKEACGLPWTTMDISAQLRTGTHYKTMQHGIYSMSSTSLFRGNPFPMLSTHIGNAY